MIRSKLNLDVDILSNRVMSNNCAFRIFATRFVRPRLFQVIRVAANAALTLILHPLNCISTAEQFIVVIIYRIRISKAPHAVSCRRIHEAAMPIYVYVIGTPKEEVEY